jgi:protein-S-isoprenylcysteine O-methyltransferase Ste14
MFVLARAITYATLFVGLLLILLPARIVTAVGVEWPATIGPWQGGGLALAAAGAAVSLWSMLAFVFVGKGTPAPFDPPRRLVVHGPYRLVRNPMYLGAAAAMLGAAMFYGTWALVGFVAAFLGAAHLFVVGYEEPTLRRMFGDEYAEYCRSVGRWWPRRSAAG